MKVRILPFIALVMVVSGCSTPPPATNVESHKAASGVIAVQAPPIKPAAEAKGPAKSEAATSMSTEGKSKNAPAPLKRSIYFGFDDYSVRNDQRTVVEEHARYLKANTSSKVQIEGHTDERGSREYNLSLGQRRADSVRALFRVLGVSDAQSSSMSWGEERPKATAHDEAAWAENRRVDLIYR